MKKSRLAKQFLAELETNPNVAVACKRVGLARQTIYRWSREDSAFAHAVEESMFLGNESVLDLAESKLLSNVSNGNQRAIETALAHFGKRSDRNKAKPPPDDPFRGKTLADLIMAANKERRKKKSPTTIRRLSSSA